ncbi:tyrosine phosphatase, non-receptor type nt1 [Culex quinquefasciatus]|uniref:protein-tyrosine-phosphatase n=1 Tax=Culex quinquefasciatus TaxID=7176 RepID=B0WY59_CULQU|nr:tyrosine phosphatase, non-receptor type nt1 [Culex quinquefasciatus]|eukprot:XP_001862331.1 tyrosine phosphatase, non-receptor type nt1 [Culex quinquefasciatus]
MSSNNSSSSTTTHSNNSGGAGTSSIEAEYNEIELRNGWCGVFQEIREKSEQEARQKDFSTDESRKTDNRRLNRYRDVSPYDHSRIVLKRGDTDYINANLVKMDRADRKYILCQGPLPLTVGHFWLMVWEYNSRAILMLNKLIEKKQIKCHQYWPEKTGEQHRLELPEVQLAVEYVNCVEYKNFCERTFRLTDLESSKTREVVQFHYTTWPDFGIPSSPVAFLQFLKEVRESGALDPDVGPPIIHCSAGIGRSGTFCLVDCCLVLIDKEGENKVSVQDILLELRRYRMGLIQTFDQLYFSYQAIIEGMKRMNNSSFEDFEELTEVVPAGSQDQDADTDDTPPPLPPPRTQSLTVSQKPLPMIPTSESVHEDFIAGKVSRDELNNRLNLEKSKQYEISSSKDRPLPPLPASAALDKLHEASNSSDNDSGGGHSGSSSEVDELIEENDSDENDVDDDDEDEEDNSDNIESSVLDDTTITSSPTSTLTTTTTAANSNTSTLESNKGAREDEHQHSRVAASAFDANATLPPLPNGVDSNSNSAGEDGTVSSPERELSSPAAELRRRKRLERQSAMEDKIREIKRKQQEVEDSKSSSSPKKRRFIMLAAGVGCLIGVLCVYLYARGF